VWSLWRQGYFSGNTWSIACSNERCH
jgi:hypothetical protein